MARTKTTKAVLSTRSGLRVYRVRRDRLQSRYIKVTPGREDARSIRRRRPQFRYGQSYYVRKESVREVVVYGLAKAPDRKYAFVGEWVFHLKPKYEDSAIISATLEEFENAGLRLYRRGPEDRIGVKVAIRGIDFERGMDILTMDQYRAILQARIAELDWVEET